MVEILPQNHAVSLGTLATATALTVGTTAITEPFLMKHLRGTWLCRDPDVGDTLLVGLARGDASVAEIKVAIELNQTERDQVNQAQARIVAWETVRTMTALTGAQGMQSDHIDQTLGGGGGIPFDADDGWQFFVMNIGSNDQVAGATVNFRGDVTGVWL